MNCRGAITRCVRVAMPKTPRAGLASRKLLTVVASQGKGNKGHIEQEAGRPGESKRFIVINHREVL